MASTPIVPTYAHVPRLEAGSLESADYLAEHGYVVIANALSGDEAAYALSLTWDFLASLGTGIDRSDPATWHDDRWPVAVHGGIIPSQGIGHSEVQWFIRSVPSVKQSFAAVWDDDDLLVSFDGMALWRPTSINSSWETNRGGSWLHVDQHPIGRPGRHCVQGAVSLLPSDPRIGGNILIPGSHRWFSEIPDRYTDRLGRIDPTIDHFRFPADDPLLEVTPPIMCHMEAGDLLLWDSRTVHCSSPAIEDGDAVAVQGDAPSLVRAASLVCFMPRSRSSAEVIDRRQRAVQTRTSTTNWSDRFINADRFPEVVARSSAADYLLPPIPDLDAAQLAMVGS